MKLSKQQLFDLWGVDGPYSEANIKIQTRILDDSVSRVMVEVEANINPLTFRIVKAAKKAFTDDEHLQQLLDHAKYMGKNQGYVVSSFSKEYTDEDVMNEAKIHLKYTEKTILKMHKYAMDLLGIG
ncbi:hypothetical protein KJ657_03440 [Patescibacteria group bacterium]|nr:hypothetical protein [Patescibacteria group bacterium]MBU1016118.1 hypothetical protein [Patescibacteria group bacterium]MBU1684861.1 hypothetical protein [Patescibacteria group bacterium]MBU1938577.1 hypothetical protein [Patescibacteria group bacterium]